MPENKCPDCLSTNIEVRGDYINCSLCGLRGDRKYMKFCERVPVFQTVKDDLVYSVKEQLYKYRDTFYTLAGFSPGCGRVVRGSYFPSCLVYMPEKTESKVKRGKVTVREREESVSGA